VFVINPLPTRAVLYLVCATQEGSPGGFLSLQWFTGTFGDVGGGCESVMVHVYLDGEEAPSLSYCPYELAGVPSIEAFAATPAEATWSSALYGRYSKTSWNSNLPVPFLTSIAITLEFKPTVEGPVATAVYYQAHGMDGVAPAFGNFGALPSGARLEIQKQNPLALKGLGYLSVVDVPSGSSGLVAGLSLAFEAPNLNTLEGCFHFFPTANTTYAASQLR
jgi:hypothetical protein